jgi:hypothetical protein
MGLAYTASYTASPKDCPAGRACHTMLKEGSRVRQKHNCLGIVFIAVIATTCFSRAWPSSGHDVGVVHKWEKHNCILGWFAAAVWVGEVQCGWGSSVEGFCGLLMCRILSGVDEEGCSIVIFSFVQDINIVTWRWPSMAETCSHSRRNKYNTKKVVFLTDPTSFF